MRQRWSRIAALCGVMLLILGGLTYRLIQLQLIQGSETAETLNSNIIRKYEELASRGEILDSQGNVLVGNALGFSVQLDYYQWDKSRQNEVILQLWELLTACGEEYNDVLALSTGEPLEYTYNSLESGNGRKLARFTAAREWGSPEDMTPNRLFGRLCAYYDVDPDLSLTERRAVVGIRYYLDDYQFSSYNTPVTLASQVEIGTVAKLSEESAHLPGVEIQVSDSREYETGYASHILGRVALIGPDEYEEKKADGYGINDTLGKDGMEKALESYLRGVSGTRAVEVDSRTGEVVSEYMLEETQPGKNCYLTLRLDLQARAEEALAETLAAIKEKGEKSKTGDGADVEGGAVVVLDVNTGEVLAMASYPTYSLATYRADLSENSQNPLKPFFNRAIQSAYSPGSTFKMCTAVAALEEGIITPRTKIRDQGIYTRYADVGYAPRCWIYRQHGGTHGVINVSQALKYSCNYFFYEMGYQLQIERLEQYAALFGLGQKTGIELTNETAGILAGPEEREERGKGTWYGGDTLMAAIGQSDNQFSPLQLANYVATLVNGGIRYQPHLLKKVMDYTNTETLLEVEPTILNRVEMADSTVQAVKEGMRGVVTEDGTASSYFRDFPIQVGGKTGSAQMVGHSATGVFVSFAPYDQPEIAVCVVGEYASSGGSLAPVAIAVYDEYFGLGLYEREEAPQETPGTATPENPVETPEG